LGGLARGMAALASAAELAVRSLILVNTLLTGGSLKSALRSASEPLTLSRATDFHLPDIPGITGSIGSLQPAALAPSGQRAGNSINSVQIPVKVEAIDLDDPEGAGSRLGSTIARKFREMFESLGDNPA